MNGVNIAQPDVTLHLDMAGVIQDVNLSSTFSDESVETMVGRPWTETVADVGVDKVKRMIEDARTQRVSVFRQITQRFPSGQELLMEYTTVRLGGKAGLLAIGKNLQAVAELQSRLIAAQQAMERDYWKLREIETRYRLLFSASNEAVLLIKASSLRVVEANPAAIRAMGLSPAGREFLPELAPRERESFQAMLSRVREHGRAPGMLVHLGRDQQAWLVRAYLMASESGPVFLLQLTPTAPSQPNLSLPEPTVSIEDLIERGPDGFVAIDPKGIILRVNRAFLDLVQVGDKGAVVGEHLGRWLQRPGADLTVLMANIRRHGLVRLFSTKIHGELGTDTEVEISAVGNTESEPQAIGLLLREMGWRLPMPNNDDALNAVLGSLSHQIGKTSLRKLVKNTVGVLERDYIETALAMSGGNRTATAELLGLSRQSLYAKLNHYGLDGDSQTHSN